MPQLIANCPRCGVRKGTFDVQAANFVQQEYGWMNYHEVCALCRHCHGYTIFYVHDDVNANYEEFHQIGFMKYGGVLNDYVKVKGHISLKDHATVASPEHVPDHIAKIFHEGVTSDAVQCYNAACAMYRLCIDLTTKSLLPPEAQATGPNAHQRGNLAARLNWLFDNDRLPASLRELSHCIREDGNDAAHDGSVDEDEAADLQDFTIHLLENVYTTPTRLALAKDRRAARRSQT
jgi:hypothetical protein